MSDSIEGISLDSIFNGKITIRQRVRGYRFSIDALLLAWYVSALPGSSALELGTGSGVISLALAFNRPDLRIDAIEVQEQLARLAKENVEKNGFKSVEVATADLKDLKGSEWERKYNFAFSNPPFRAVGRGRLNPDEEKALARHEILSTLSDVVECGARCIRPTGYFGIILIAERIEELEKISDRYGLHISHCCRVRPYQDKSANLILVLMQEKGSNAPLDSDLYIWEKKGIYSPSVKAILNGDWGSIPHPLKETGIIQ